MGHNSAEHAWVQPGRLKAPVFVISLDRSTTRRLHMQAMLKAIGIEAEYVSAIDGRMLTPNQRARYDADAAARIYGCQMSQNEIGCCLSHLAILGRIVRENIPCALILEDDVACGPDFVSVVNELCAQADPEWSLVRLETQKPVLNDPVSRRTTGRLASRLQKGGLFRMERGILGAGAYLVRREAAVRILEQGQRLYMPFDQMLDRYWENGVIPFLVRPFPARQMEEAFDSEIGARGRVLEGKPGLRRIAVRRAQRARDAFAKRLFWASYESRSVGALLRRLGVNSAHHAMRAASGLATARPLQDQADG